MSGSLWTRLEQLIDGATDDDVRSHRLQAVAAPRRRSRASTVPEDFVLQERAAAMAAITAPVVLERVATAYDSPVVVIKGPDLAELYPQPTMRNYWDIDLLAGDAPRAQAALVAAGFQEIGDPRLYENLHHLRPLLPSGLALAVELHTAPKWPDGLTPPSTTELFEAAAPRAGRPELVLSLPPEHHVLVLTAHSWAHEPLRRLRDILDIALVAALGNDSETETLARSWGMSRLWRTTLRVVDAVAHGERLPYALRTWARNLATARERTVLESHVERLFSDFSAMPTHRAFVRLPAQVARDLRPEESEPWRAKLARMALAFRNARRPRSKHEGELDRRD